MKCECRGLSTRDGSRCTYAKEAAWVARCEHALCVDCVLDIRPGVCCGCGAAVALDHYRPLLTDEELRLVREGGPWGVGPLERAVPR